MADVPVTEQHYGGLLTLVGQNKEANAKVNKTPIDITHIAIGDGGGEYVVPDEGMTELVNEVARYPLNVIEVQHTGSGTPLLFIEAVVPATDGGFTVREMSAVDADGDMIAIANCAPNYKPAPSQNAPRMLPIRMIFAITSDAAWETNINDDLVMASREWTERTFTTRNASLDSLNTNLVDTLSLATPIKGMYYRKVSDDSLAIGVLHNHNNAAEYVLRKDSDGFLLLRGGFVSEEGMTDKNPDLPLGDGSGTQFVLPQDGNKNCYATQVGAKITTIFEGDSLFFRHYSDDRGGVWAISIDSGDPILHSTFKTVAESGNTLHLIADGLDYGIHSVVAEFLGDDPDNPPSGGPGTSRGWFYYDHQDPGSSSPKTFAFRTGALDWPNRQEVISESSIPDFAIAAKAEPFTGLGHWIPRHGGGGLGSAARNISREIYIDGRPFVEDISQLSMDRVRCNTIYVKQKYTAYSTYDENGDFPLWDGVIVHSVNAGILSVSHTITVNPSNPVEATGYLSMFPFSMGETDRIILNNGSEYPIPNSVDSTITTEIDQLCTSAAIVSGSGGFAAACQIGALADSVDIKSLPIPRDSLFFTARADGVSKLYWKRFNSGSPMKPGDRHRVINRYFMAKHPDIDSIV
ncbi:phage tail protein [Alloalcanivorax xenomutans]|uniref:phage tail protein n=1 Tax=Alloalcanivorax xenomutans TaxID=1094342 RepID=UPI003BA99303